MPQYPLIGPHVQSIFEYIKFEEEDIHLRPFEFDLLEYFGLPEGFNYDVDFFDTPLIGDDLVVSPLAYGVISTCDVACGLASISSTYTYHIGQLIAGPAIRIVVADKDNAVLYAAVYNARDHVVVFCRFVFQPLINYGFKLGVKHNIILHDGDQLKLQGTGITYIVTLNDVLIIGPVTDIGVDAGNECVGVVEIRGESTPVLRHRIDSFESIYAARVFYYCNDGININHPLTPLTSAINTTVNNTSVLLKSGQEGEVCYGFGYAQGFTDTDVALAAGRGYRIEFQFKYFTTATGNPISGLAFLIDESKADPDDFTGWVALINKQSGKIQLAYYLNESLSNLPDPTHIVLETTKAIADNTLVKVIASFGADVLDTAWFIEVYTKQPGETVYTTDLSYLGANQLPEGAQLSVRRARTNYGLAWVGNIAPGNHIAFWSGNITQQYAVIN